MHIVGDNPISELLKNNWIDENDNEWILILEDADIIFAAQSRPRAYGTMSSVGCTSLEVGYVSVQHRFDVARHS